MKPITAMQYFYGKINSINDTKLNWELNLMYAEIVNLSTSMRWKK